VLRKYLNPRVVAYRDVTSTMRAVGMYGVRSRDALADACGLHSTALALLVPYAHVAAIVDDVEVRVARVPDLGLDGFEIYVPAERFDDVWKRLAAAGSVTRGGLSAYDVARVEGGRPEWGVDIDDSTIPQEANFDELHAISYTKGCYTGQEVVARVHFRGHVNRHLRGILFDEASMLPPRAALFDSTGKVGRRRAHRAALAPARRHRGSAMVRREVPIGATLVARDAAAPADDDGAPTPENAPAAPVEERLVTRRPRSRSRSERHRNAPRARHRRDGPRGHVPGGAAARGPAAACAPLVRDARAASAVGAIGRRPRGRRPSSTPTPSRAR
jgi:folate-binding protein YgfZ